MVIPTPTYSSIKDSLKTGDLIFFHGSLTADNEIYLLEDLRLLPHYSHVGVVFRFPESDPSDDPLFWQAAPPIDGEQYGNDYIKNIPADGCQLVNLTTVLNWASTPSEDGNNPTTFAYRSISPVLSSDVITLMENFIRLICGRSFSYPESGVFAGSGMAVDYSEGILFGRQSANTTFFCSKLASATYQAAGLIPSTVVTNSILPGNMASDFFDLLNGYSLSDAQVFTVTPPGIASPQ